jgi:hypothetical protein
LGADGWTGSLVRALAQRFRDLEHQFRNAGLRRGTQPPPIPSFAKRDAKEQSAAKPEK